MAMLTTPSKKGKSLLGSLLNDWAVRLEKVKLTPAEHFAPVDEWIEQNFYVDRPRDVITAKELAPGPIHLAEYQKRIIKEAFARDADGKLKYSTVVWSEPKKSGKTALAAAIGLYAAYHTPATNIFCLANDGKQSQDRIFRAIDRCVSLHHSLGGIFSNVRPLVNPPKIKLDNGTVIEAIPCDAAGEAGSEPFLTIWSEMWGYSQAYKERLWTEMTIPPTLYGYAMRWIESYAGYEDESTVLWSLYDVGVNNGRQLWDDLPVFVNDNARQITFWSNEPRQPWQTQEYYQAESLLLTPNEFLRIHRNQWVTSTQSLFDDISIWDRCMNRQLATALPPGDNTPVVIAVDASVSGDCSAVVAVSRHPQDAWDEPTRRAIERYSMCWYPPKGGKMNYAKTIEPCLRELIANLNVYAIVYDPYQLHKLCTDLYMEGLGNFKEFQQTGRRLKADKQLYDMVIHRQFIHSGNEEMRTHALNAAAKSEADGKFIRIIKKATGRPIDLIVATSMAVDELLRLNS